MDYDIQLTSKETDLLTGIEFDQSKLDYERHARQKRLVLKLWKSLAGRDAIPENRWHYWSDPEYQIGQINASHNDLFERYGRQGEEIYVHPHFLEYLRYFLFGAQLPERAISEFEKVVGDPKGISSGDLPHIRKETRAIIRKFGLQNKEEEFYRLALDVGLSQWFAQSVREAAKQV